MKRYTHYLSVRAWQNTDIMRSARAHAQTHTHATIWEHSERMPWEQSVELLGAETENEGWGKETVAY